MRGQDAPTDDLLDRGAIAEQPRAADQDGARGVSEQHPLQRREQLVFDLRFELGRPPRRRDALVNAELVLVEREVVGPLFAVGRWRELDAHELLRLGRRVRALVELEELDERLV